MTLAGASCGQRVPDPPLPPLTPETDTTKVQAWRDKHETDYLREWVSIAGLHMLETGTHTVGGDASNAIAMITPDTAWPTPTKARPLVS